VTAILHLHAGFYKTGSTAIQNYLYARDLDKEYTYFHDGNPNSSLFIMQAFKNDLADQPQFKRDRLTPAEVSKSRHNARSRFEKIVNGINSEHTVLSAEAICALEPDECENLYQFFSQFYDELRVHIYIRPTKSRIESAYQECLKARFRSLEQRFPISFEQGIGTFDRVFGRRNVHLYKFSRSEFPEGSVVKHFINQVGMQCPEDAFTDENIGLSLPAIQLLYCYRRIFPEWKKDDSRRLQLLSELQGCPFHFHSDLYEKLLYNPDGDTSWLETRAGFSISEDVYAHNHTGVESEQDLTNISSETFDFLEERQRGFRLRSRDVASVALGVNNL
jgi:hypothetical protein